LDPAPANFDAVADRHIGQQNVHVTKAPSGGEIRVGFVMANGRATTTEFRLEATHILVNPRALRHIVPGDSVLRKAEEITLKPARSNEGRSKDRLTVELAAGELLEVELRARVPREAMPGSTILMQLAQYEDQRPTR
jgi:hypothetical protein